MPERPRVLSQKFVTKAPINHLTSLYPPHTHALTHTYVHVYVPSFLFCPHPPHTHTHTHTHTPKHTHTHTHTHTIAYTHTHLHVREATDAVIKRKCQIKIAKNMRLAMCLRRDSFVCVTWLICVRDTICDSFVCVTWLICVCDTIWTYVHCVCHDSFMQTYTAAM